MGVWRHTVFSSGSTSFITSNEMSVRYEHLEEKAELKLSPEEMEVGRNMVTLSRASQDHDSLLCWGNPRSRCQNLVTAGSLLCWLGWTVKKQSDDPCIGPIPSRPTNPGSSCNIYGMNSSRSFYLKTKPTRPLLNGKHKGSRAGFVTVSHRWPRPLLLSCFWTPPDPFRSLRVRRRFNAARPRDSDKEGLQSSRSQGFPWGPWGNREPWARNKKGVSMRNAKSTPLFFEVPLYLCISALRLKPELPGAHLHGPNCCWLRR